jgi:hypothetical protein
LHARHAQIARRAILPHAVGIALHPKSVASFARPALTRGALRDRHERWERDAMDAACHETNDVAADGEVVWSWRPDAGAKLAKTLTRLASDGGKRARSPGRARRKPLKPLRREGRVISAVPVVLPRAFCCTRTMGVSRHPAFPAPSSFDEGDSDANLGRFAPRERDLMRRQFFPRRPGQANDSERRSGTHNHRRIFLSTLGRLAFVITQAGGYGSSRSRGRRLRLR